MAQRRSYSSSYRNGKKKFKRVNKEYPETLLPEQEAEADFISSLILILIIISLVGVVWFIAGPKTNLDWVSGEVSTITKR